MFNINNINKNLNSSDVDTLYHFGINSSMNIKEVFKNITHVLFTRSKSGSGLLAQNLFQNLYNVSQKISCIPLYKTERFHLYLVDSVIIVSYGYGAPSMLICLNEIFKLLYHANMLNSKIIMLGDCSGINLPYGTVIINNIFYNNRLEEKMGFIECGKYYTYDTRLNSDLMNEIIHFSKGYTEHSIEIGALVSTFDFFEEQGRLDGFLCPQYNQEQVDEYYNLLINKNIKCFDTVSLEFAGLCNHLNLNACAINYVIENHKKIVDDNNSNSENNMFKFIIKYIFSSLKRKK